jgi:hypothetical protein
VVIEGTIDAHSAEADVLLCIEGTIDAHTAEADVLLLCCCRWATGKEELVKKPGKFFPLELDYGADKVAAAKAKADAAKVPNLTPTLPLTLP